MIDFGCREFVLDEIIKCGLGLTKAEFRIFGFFVKSPGRHLSTDSIAKQTRLDLSTVQKAVKKLSGKGILLRSQKNLENGGYVFLYRCSSKAEIREIIKGIIRRWSSAVEQKVDEW